MRKLTGVALLFLTVQAHALRIIARENVSSSFASAATNSFTIYMPNQGECTNSLLAVNCGNDASTITNEQAGGIIMTKQIGLTSSETDETWTLSHSTMTGVITVVLTNGAIVNCGCVAQVFCNVADNPKDSSNSAQATGTNPSITDVVVSSGSILFFGAFNNGTTMQPSTAQQNISGANFNAGGPSAWSANYSGPVEAGTVAIGVTQPISGAWTKTVLAIRPSTGTPIVETSSATILTATTATAYGILYNANGFPISSEGICVSTHAFPTTADNCFTATGTPFSVTITGLIPGMANHFRAYAINAPGTDYGTDLQIMPPVPTGLYQTAGTGSLVETSGNGSLTAQ